MIIQVKGLLRWFQALVMIEYLKTKVVCRIQTTFQATTMIRYLKTVHQKF
jgi:hypothetical protein